MINSIDRILNDANLELKDINQICVVSGPGSFTSTRIGVTIAKTLSYCLNVDIKCTTYLEILGYQVKDNSNKIIEMPEKNGHFIATYKDDIVSEMFYLSNKEYEEYKNKNSVYENLSIDYQQLIEFIKNLPTSNKFDVNPVYIKTIGALNG